MINLLFLLEKGLVRIGIKTENALMTPINSMNRIAVNSTVLYVIAFLFTTILHESFHALFGILYGSQPVLHHNYVEHLNWETVSRVQSMVIALAGPLVSLTQGITAGALFFKLKKYDLLQLLVAWISILGFINFLGYVMTGPMFRVGDIGKVYHLLETPLYLQIIFAVIAGGVLIVITLKMSKAFLRFATRQEWLQTGQYRKKMLFHIIILPWIFGSLIMTGLYLPIIALISIIYPVMSGFVLIGPWQNGENITDVLASKSTNNEKLSIKYISIVILLSLIFKFVLQPGILL